MSKKEIKTSIKEEKKQLVIPEAKGPRTEPLKKWEISYCQREYVRVMHPIKDRTYCMHICPSLAFLCKRKKISFEKALVNCFHNEMGCPDVNDNGAEEEASPFLVMGYGINAYFDFLGFTGKLFVWLTIFSMPAFYYFSQGHFFIGNEGMQSLTIGNMGGAGTRCFH